MTAIINTATASATSALPRPRWQTIVSLVLAFWLSSSILLDVVIMPTMYATGMMAEPGFSTAGYSLFWMFNRIELLCAALVLSGMLLLRNTLSTVSLGGRWAMPLALSLFAIALTYTYGLTPEMSALGLPLDLFNPLSPAPVLMDQLHMGYWLLEVVKLSAGSGLLWFCYRQR